MANENINELIEDRYKYGFTTDVESESFPPGLNEDIIRALIMSSFNPGGKDSDSTSVVNPYLYRSSISSFIFSFAIVS